MEPTRDPTPPPTRRRWTDRWPGIDVRPLWLATAGFALLGMGVLILVIASGIDTGSAIGVAWSNVAFVAVAVVLGLSLIFLCLIPGALVALRHPWGDVYLRVSGPPFAHPRLFGLTLVWTGLLMSGVMGAYIFLSASAWSDVVVFSRTIAILLAIGIVAVVPLAAVLLLDRGREPPDGEAR